MALESDETNIKIADNLGVNYKTLTNWIYQSMKKPTADEKSIDYKSRYQELVDENNKLKKNLKLAQQERDILKKPPHTLRAKIRKVCIYSKS
jgi:transposase